MGEYILIPRIIAGDFCTVHCKRAQLHHYLRDITSFKSDVDLLTTAKIRLYHLIASPVLLNLKLSEVSRVNSNNNFDGNRWE